MPIVLSEIIEDSHQTDGRRWITEEHTAGTGKTYRVTYLAESGTSVETVMAARVSGLDQSLVDTEIARFMQRVEDGLDINGISYAETTNKVRLVALLDWLKLNIKERNFDPVQWAYLVFDPYTEAQIGGVLTDTVYEGREADVKSWIAKIKAMKLAMDEVETNEVETDGGDV